MSPEQIDAIGKVLIGMWAAYLTFKGRRQDAHIDELRQENVQCKKDLDQAHGKLRELSGQPNAFRKTSRGKDDAGTASEDATQTDDRDLHSEGSSPGSAGASEVDKERAG